MVKEYRVMCKREIIDKLSNWELLREGTGLLALSYEQGTTNLAQWLLYVPPGLTLKILHSANRVHMFCMAIRRNSDYFPMRY
jgi:hypothetical protein